jgi:myo-inositol-1(or 4)-monophosphatase
MMAVRSHGKPHQNFLEAAVKAAREAGRLQMEAFDQEHVVRFKAENDLVTEVDRACEDAVVGILRERFPSHDFLLEETESPRTGSPYLWVVDPVDGTTNYAHRLPHFCCSIGLQHDGRMLVGVVFDPFRKELFTVTRDAGACLNGRPIRVSSQTSLRSSLLATGFPREIWKVEETNLEKFGRMVKRVQSIRRSGSAALDLCYLAAGRFDGYWVVDLEPWDAAAGVLMVEEAGGRVTDLAGKPYVLEKGGLAASNGRIHGALMDVLHPE